MVKITVPDDCGNAPKKVFIRDFNIAFAENNTEKILTFMADDIIWNMVGEKILHGKDEVREFLKSMESDVPTELILHTVVTHGNTAAANGEMKFPKMTAAFCDVYTFSSFGKEAKIKTLTSYDIELK